MLLITGVSRDLATVQGLWEEKDFFWAILEAWEAARAQAATCSKGRETHTGLYTGNLGKHTLPLTSI